MKLEITIGDCATELELPPGSHMVGGAAEDGVRIEGLGPALFRLRIEGARLLVSSREPFGVDGVLSPPAVLRLVLPGERVQLAAGTVLRQLCDLPPAERPQTAAVLRELLSGSEEPQGTGCAALTCLTGLDVGRRFPVVGPTVEIGRGETVHLRVRDRAVSRRHARIRRGPEGRYLIEDLGSPNGLYVNGRRTRGKLLLADGAVVEMGHSLLRFSEPLPGPAVPLRSAVEPDEGAAPGSPASPDGQASPEGQAPGSPPEALPRAAGAPGSAACRIEQVLIGIGMCLALLGALVTYGILTG